MAKKAKEMGDGQPSHDNWTVVKKSFSVKKDIMVELLTLQGKYIKETGKSWNVSQVLDKLLRPILIAAVTKTRKKKASKRRK